MAMNSLWKTKSVPKQVDYPLPREWESQTKDVELKQVKPSSHEYQQAERLLHKTLPKVRLLNILRIQNKYLWRRYNQTRENIHRKLGKHVEEKLLFHGSGGVEPEKIYKSETGFDIRTCPVGLWGQALYFFEQASDCDSCKYSSSATSQIFLVKTLTGDCIAIPPAPSCDFRRSRTDAHSSILGNNTIDNKKCDSSQDRRRRRRAEQNEEDNNKRHHTERE
ncbi:probable poly [ADP-ribose] polymerase DDB_G0278045 [Sycon ciliatum]|uniref:probable poly [ADP-ribose] polymerase DDB_G0278045 n=1 Tax=Sycon ciliatum TaxID=27933 RepID=UPI0031F66469